MRVGNTFDAANPVDCRSCDFVFDWNGDRDFVQVYAFRVPMESDASLSVVAPYREKPTDLIGATNGISRL